MIAYKGFNKDLTCTMGKGRFQYEVGKSYKEDSAKCKYGISLHRRAYRGIELVWE